MYATTTITYIKSANRVAEYCRRHRHHHIRSYWKCISGCKLLCVIIRIYDTHTLFYFLSVSCRIVSLDVDWLTMCFVRDCSETALTYSIHTNAHWYILNLLPISSPLSSLFYASNMHSWCFLPHSEREISAQRKKS